MRDLLLPLLVTAADYLALHGKPLTPAVDSLITTAAKNQEVYENAMLQAVKDRYEGRTTDGEFKAVFLALVYASLRRAWNDGVKEAGAETLDVQGENELAAYQVEEATHVNSLLLAILAALAAGLGWQAVRHRVMLWGNRYEDARNRAAIIAGKRTGVSFIWQLGVTEKHCKDCAGYAGQTKTAVEWDEIYSLYGHAPQSHDLECGGWLCDCRLKRV